MSHIEIPIKILIKEGSIPISIWVIRDPSTEVLLIYNSLQEALTQNKSLEINCIPEHWELESANYGKLIYHKVAE